MKNLLKTVSLLLILIVAANLQKTFAQDWPGLNRYWQANQKLEAPARGKHRVVYMGDSITDIWNQLDSAFFADNPYVDRGISGQTTPQMLVRFRADVVKLHPDVVVILAGTNDIAGNTGLSTLGMIENNLASMSEIAEANNINVILCSVLPASAYPWNPRVKNVAQKIKGLNNWIEQYSKRNDYTFCNYYPALVNDEGGMISKYSQDGVHPNKAGFAVMEKIIKAKINNILTK